MRLRRLQNKYRTLPMATETPDLDAAHAGTAHHVRLRGLPARAGRNRRRHSGWPRCAGGHADRQRQIALLPASGAPARRSHHRGVAADRADAQPGGAALRLWHCGGGVELGERSGGKPLGARSHRARRNASRSTSRPNGWCEPTRSISSSAPRSRCSRSTKRIASRNGATIFAPNTPRSARCRRRSAACRRSPSRPPPTPPPAPIFCKSFSAVRRRYSCTASTGPICGWRCRQKSAAANRSAISSKIMRARAASSIAPRGARPRSWPNTCARAASRRCPITPAWKRPRARAIRMLSCRRTASSWSRPWRSAWASTSRTCASCCTPTCRRTSRAIIRRSAAPAATGCRPIR